MSASSAHGISVSDLAPSRAGFIAIVPAMLYSFVGIELPSAAAEEMVEPRRDIPAAIRWAGIGQALADHGGCRGAGGFGLRL